MKSGSIQEVKATPVDKGTWPHLLAAEFVAALLSGIHVPVLHLGERSVAAALQSEPNAEPIKSTLVLWSSGVAHHVPPNGGWCDHPWSWHHRADFRPVHRPEPSNKPEDRSLRHLHDRAPHVWAVLVDRLVLPRSCFNSRFLGVTDCSSSCEVEMSATSVILIAVIVLVVLAGASFATLARRSDVRGAGASATKPLPATAAVKQQEPKQQHRRALRSKPKPLQFGRVPTSCRLKTSPQSHSFLLTLTRLA